MLVFVGKVQEVVFDLLNRFLVKQFFFVVKEKKSEIYFINRIYAGILKIFKAFRKVVNPKTKNALTIKSEIKKNLRILLRANTRILFNKINSYIIKILIIKAIPIIKTLEIPNV